MLIYILILLILILIIIYLFKYHKNFLIQNFGKIFFSSILLFVIFFKIKNNNNNEIIIKEKEEKEEECYSCKEAIAKSFEGHRNLILNNPFFDCNIDFLFIYYNKQKLNFFNNQKCFQITIQELKNLQKKEFYKMANDLGDLMLKDQKQLNDFVKLRVEYYKLIENNDFNNLELEQIQNYYLNKIDDLFN